RRKARQNGQADAGLVGRAGAGRKDDGFGRALGDLVERDTVVAHHFGLRSKLSEIVGEVVGEAVVIIDHQDARGSPLAAGPHWIPAMNAGMTLEFISLSRPAPKCHPGQAMQDQAYWPTPASPA